MKSAYHVTESRYGFKWGPALIERTCSDRKWGVLVSIKGLRGVVEVRVTPSGIVKVELSRLATAWDKERIQELI